MLLFTFVLLVWCPCGAGGNQRELARQKHAKKQNEIGKGKRNEDGLSAAARKQRDAEIMQQKQKKANEGGKASPKSK
uniref:Small EDRK-rich factor 2b n=1 Tax=Oryzias melastigma TaxID=30732 RepID=A0A3B3C3R3_ORYME